MKDGNGEIHKVGLQCFQISICKIVSTEVG